MIPGKIVSSDNLIMSPKDKTQNLKESWDVGGIALMDSTRGLFYQNWQIKTDGQKIYIKAENEKQWREVLSDVKITEVDLTFDQNMRPVLTYVSGGIAKLYWYDTVSQSQTITDFPNVQNPRVSLDDKRAFNTANSDVIFAYINNDQLCCRYQRERYGIEHVLHQLPPKTQLVKIVRHRIDGLENQKQTSTDKHCVRHRIDGLEKKRLGYI